MGDHHPRNRGSAGVLTRYQPSDPQWGATRDATTRGPLSSALTASVRKSKPQALGAQHRHAPTEPANNKGRTRSGDPEEPPPRPRKGKNNSHGEKTRKTFDADRTRTGRDTAAGTTKTGTDQGELRKGT